MGGTEMLAYLIILKIKVIKMLKKEAMKILVSGMCVDCTNGFKTVVVYPQSIELNIENNNYELNLDWIQDFDTPDDNIIAGLSLSELEVLPL